MSTRRRQRGGQGATRNALATNAVAQQVNATVSDPRVAGALQNNLREALKVRLQRMRESYEVIRDELRTIVKDTKSALTACNPYKGRQVTGSSKERLERISTHIKAFSARDGQNYLLDILLPNFANYCNTHIPKNKMTDETLVKDTIFTDRDVIANQFSNYVVPAIQNIIDSTYANYQSKGIPVTRDSLDVEIYNQVIKSFGYIETIDNLFLHIDEILKNKNTRQPLQGGDTRRKNRGLK